MMPNANTDIVDLTFKGDMLMNLKVAQVDFGNEPLVISFSDTEGMSGEIPTIPVITITIGFDNEKQAQKAVWSIEKGRDFMGLPDEQLQEIIDNWMDGWQAIA